MTIDFERVDARGLVKTFGPTRALAGVDVALRAGLVTVIEGPNGSGKTTLLGILSLLVRPTRGTVRFGSHDALASADALRATIGVLAHAAMVYPDLTGAESLALAAKLHGVRDADRRIAALRERFEIGPFGERPTRTYSRGQLQRIALARALIHEPRLLLLDEPSTGLDPASVDRLIAAVRVERARGAIVVLVTHDVPLAEAIGDRRVRLSRGRVEQDEPLAGATT
ncbi:ABC transporter ATP-binding protein [Sandaracinus amylolyticus]|uniref:Methionine ABC transporter ATP-binding protein n=1 Tax=Sandaracinus amylolyticus TaxID=927083 RepID=A0A0F6W6V2_9BACT|nr:ABC transporter ATP-binding protein [Sandaracinus amylolyticus]AKF08930.1 Methionine ABC transporter ATP-binding protein [Sandaracinus amylolyticus]